MAKQVCQSCGQPINNNNRGTEADKSLSQEYCNLCYENGSFKEPNITLEQMEDKYVETLVAKRVPEFMASIFARLQLPKLKRWQNVKAN